MKLFSLLPLAALLVIGCSDSKDDTVPEAWKKTTETEKLERIMKMPIGPQMKIEGIKNLKISEEEKTKAIAEVTNQPAPVVPGPPK